MSSTPEAVTRHRTYFTVVPLAFIAAVLAMTLVSAWAAPEGDNLLLQLAKLADDSTAYQWGFVLAAVVPVLAVMLTAGVGVWLVSRGSGGVSGAGYLGLVGAFLVAAYAPLSAVAYVSQFTILPKQLAANFQDAQTWYLGYQGSIPLTMDMLGYALYGAGAILIAVVLVRRPAPLAWAGWSLLLCGVLAVLAFILHVLDNDAARITSVVSGALTIPFALGIFLQAQRPMNEGPAEAASVPAPAGDVASVPKGRDDPAADREPEDAVADEVSDEAPTGEDETR
jgi:hypothetical protein